MYRKQVRRRRAVLVSLVVACLVLISSHFSESEQGPLHSVQAGVGGVLGPLEEGASKALKPLRDLVNWFDETFDARGENEQLKKENAQLRQDLTDLTGQLEKVVEKGEIGKLVEESGLNGFTQVDANVIGGSPSTFNSTIQIDKGESAGVEVDDAVIAGDGLVGRVTSTSGGSSRVQLLTDQDSAVTARVMTSRTTGIVTAEVGDPDDLIFELIKSGEEVDGEILVTAGFANEDGDLASLFPADIPIGLANESNPEQQETEQRVTVDPFVDLTRLEFVTVLTGGPS